VHGRAGMAWRLACLPPPICLVEAGGGHTSTAVPVQRFHHIRTSKKKKIWEWRKRNLVSKRTNQSIIIQGTSTTTKTQRRRLTRH